MKFDKLTEAYMNVVTEGKTQLRKYRVGLDRPGSGWETIISAKSEKEAVAKANSAYEFGDNNPNKKANYVHDITDEPEQGLSDGNAQKPDPRWVTDINDAFEAIKNGLWTVDDFAVYLQEVADEDRYNSV